MVGFPAVDIFLLFEESRPSKGSTELPLQWVPRLFPQAKVAGTSSWPRTSIKRRDGKIEGTIPLLPWVCAVRRLQRVLSQIRVMGNVSRVWFVHKSWTNGEIPDSWCLCSAWLRRAKTLLLYKRTTLTPKNFKVLLPYLKHTASVTKKISIS